MALATAAHFEKRQKRPSRRPHLWQSVSQVGANPARRKRLENRRGFDGQAWHRGKPQRQIPATRPHRRIPRVRGQPATGLIDCGFGIAVKCVSAYALRNFGVMQSRNEEKIEFYIEDSKFIS